MSRVGGLQHQLNHLTGVEVAADELGVGFVLFEGHDGEMMGFHYGGADGSDALEEILGMSRAWAGQWFDKDYARVW